ncbi:MAG TPA: hypothetical protein PLD20_12310 [Blastocatellia bacterium]|nr:hypothetical protein [Blastocatellia bacterium]HMV86403.1 hypothetical protein [Blastocatellia bacterium]HMX27620.1 hypothetical protein [Blastocatellia bacterium]HMY74532.1 hypothetical protein [Blastocatellia bacterium]HMZ18709.1 hypothetical protein [Blastocatellia bacterium]
MVRRYSAVLLGMMLMASVTLVAAQTQPPSMPADRKAYTDATKITDPDKKVDALEKFIADFPKNSSVMFAHQTIFDTLVKNHPEQKDKIIANAEKAIEKAQDFMRPSMYEQMARKLLDAGVLLDEAEKLTNKGMAAIDEEMMKQAKSRKAASYAMLGRIFLKQDKLKEAEQNFQRAKDANPRLVAAATGLAELYAKQGKEQLALETYMSAALNGKLSTAERKQFEALYSKTNNGSLAGLEEKLDAEYVKLNPSPVKVEHYKPTDKRSNRTVLAEVFTGAGCGPCVAADLGFDAMMERYKREELVVLMYHLHIPAPDPMTNLATQARGKFYTVQGVPSYAMDGKSASGGGTRDMTQGFYDRVNPDVERQLQTAAGADLKLEATLEGNTVKTKVALSNLTGDSDKLKLHVVLAEDKLRYTGENGVRFHPMVVRSVAGPEYSGLPVAGKDNQTFDWSFDVAAVAAEAKKHLDDFEKSGARGDFTFSEKKDQIDPNNLTVIAFVQDEKTKAVLQSVQVKVKRPVASNSGN